MNNSQYGTDPSQVCSFEIKLNGLLTDFTRVYVDRRLRRVDAVTRSAAEALAAASVKTGFDLLLSGSAIGSLINSPFIHQLPAFSRSLHGVNSYRQLGNKLVQLAEQAHAFRQFERVNELGPVLSNTGLAMIFEIVVYLVCSWILEDGRLLYFCAEMRLLYGEAKEDEGSPMLGEVTVAERRKAFLDSLSEAEEVQEPENKISGTSKPEKAI